MTGNETMWFDRVFTNTSLGSRILHRLDLTNLRHVFYLITPYETSVSTIDEVPNYNIQISTWWMTLIFLEFCVLKLSNHEDRYALNDSITSISAGMLSQCFKFGGRSVAIFLYVFIWNNFRIIELPWDSPWTWILCFFFQDFMYYLGHRAVHEFGFFWGLHTIHHSSEYYNLSTALRQAAIQDAGLAIYDVLQAFCIPPPIFLVHRYFSEIYQFWMHTSLLGSLGPLGYVLNTPSHHRVHHGRNAYCIDRNFGGVLIIWDRMFHTFEAERLEDPPIYGLIKNVYTFNQLWLQFGVLKELLFDKWRMKDSKTGEPIFKGWREKLKALFFPPGYFPGVEVVSYFHWWSLKDHTAGVPDIVTPVEKYNPPMSTFIKSYCIVQFLLLLAIFLHFEYDRHTMSSLDVALKVAFFVCTMQSFSGFFESKWYAPVIELFRCVGVVAFIVYKFFDKHGILPNRIFITSFFALCGIFWTGYLIRQAIGTPKISQCDFEKAPNEEKADSRDLTATDKGNTNIACVNKDMVSGAQYTASQMAGQVPNPIENLWGILVSDVYADCRQFDNVNQLKAAIQAAWDRVPLGTLVNLVYSIPNRMVQTIEKSGNVTSY